MEEEEGGDNKRESIGFDAFYFLAEREEPHDRREVSSVRERGVRCARFSVLETGGPHVSLLATRFVDWCVIKALLLRKAVSSPCSEELYR